MATGGPSMRIAVISDIHGNSAALDAVLADVARRGVDRVVNLGDSLCGPLDPVGTAERLMAADFPTISGNHDRWLYDPPGEEMPLWEVWTLPLLGEAEMNWVRALPSSLVVEGVLLSHGTPASDNENWLHRRDEAGELRPSHLWEVEAAADGHDFPVLLSGHTHLPAMVRLPDGRLLVNPGSVGCPAYLDDRHDPARVAETGAPDARYAVIERSDGVWQSSLHMVPYDSSAMVDQALAKGADSWARALATGWTRPEP